MAVIKGEATLIGIGAWGPTESPNHTHDEDGKCLPTTFEIREGGVSIWNESGFDIVLEGDKAREFFALVREAEEKFNTEPELMTDAQKDEIKSYDKGILAA